VGESGETKAACTNGERETWQHSMKDSGNNKTPFSF